MDPTNPFGAMSQTNPFAADPASMPVEEPQSDSTPPHETEEEVDTVGTPASFPDEMIVSNGVVSAEVGAVDAAEAEQSPPDSSDDDAEVTAGGVSEQEVAVATNPFLSFSLADAPKVTDTENDTSDDTSEDERTDAHASEPLAVAPVTTKAVDEGPVVHDTDPESALEAVAAPLPVPEEIMSSPSSPENVDDEVCACVCVCPACVSWPRISITDPVVSFVLLPQISCTFVNTHALKAARLGVVVAWHAHHTHRQVTRNAHSSPKTNPS